MSSPRAVWVGRERELERLDGLLQRTLAGSGGCALVLGEAGIGKTRLLEELAERARSRGLVTAWGRGWELGQAPSFWPWLELLRVLVRRPLAPEAQAQRLMRAWPEVAGGEIAGGADASTLFDAVHAYLQAHARAEPLALFIDDLVDPSSLALAEFLVPRLSAERVALLGSQRTLAAAGSEPTPPSLRLGRLAERLTLAPLTRADVATWLQRATGDTGAETARRIHDASDGNPLFVSELLRLPEHAPAGPDATLPPSLRALLRERLGALGLEARALLGAAALLGRQFTLPLLTELTGAASEALAGVCHEATRVGVLGALAPGHYRFSHALMAETLVLDLEPVRRARLHRRAAEALERWHAGDPAAPVNEIARHWLGAGVEAAPLAVEAAERAARQASLRFAFSDAAQLYQRALEALALCPPGNGQRQAELLVGRVEALARAGQRERAEAACAETVELARVRGDGALLARAALALGAESHLGKADSTVARLLERSLALLPEGDGALRAMVSARLASARQPEPDPEAPMALAREAIAMARRIGAPALLLNVIHAALGALMDFAPPEERAALNAEALALATRAGDPARALGAAQRLAFDRLELGELRAFEHAVRHYEASSAELEQPRYAWVPAMFRAMRADWEGDRERARRWEREARARRDQGNAEGSALVPARPLAIALLHEDAALLGGFLAELVARAPEASGSVWLTALHAAWRGDHEAVRAALDTLAARGLSRVVGRPESPAGGGQAAEAGDAPGGALGIEPSHSVGLGYLLMPEIAVEIACHIGDAAWADALYATLSPAAGKPFLLTTIGFSLHGAVDHALMRLSALGGRWEVAERHAARALELCTRLGARPLVARIHLDGAALCRARSARAASDDERRALERRARLELERAGAIARELGTPALLERVQRSLAEDASPAPAAPRGAPHLAAAPEAAASLRLTLEGEYWTVSAGDQLCRVQDSRGMQMLARLIEQPGRELHVLELSGSPSGADTADAGEALDARARAEYEARLRELQGELEEASSFNDLGRGERLAREKEALLRELARGFGLGGRARRSASTVERARVNVRRRLALALRRIRAASPALGAHVEACLRTGVFCVYTPRGGSGS